MGFLAKTNQIFSLLPHNLKRRKLAKSRLLGQRLEERTMLAIEIDFVPVDAAISTNEPGTFVVPAGEQFELEVQIQSDTEELLVRWEMHFNSTAEELCLSSFDYHQDWIPNGVLDSCNGAFRVRGANLAGIRLLPGVSYVLGQFQVQAPEGDGAYELSVQDPMDVVDEHTEFIAPFGPLPIAGYGDKTILVESPQPMSVVARDDFYSTFVDTPITFDPTVNDVTNGARPLLLGEPQNGSLAVIGDGTLRYVPTPGFVGTDSFDYSLDNGTSSDVATVTIEVELPNGAPSARADVVKARINTPLVIDVLENDTDPNGDELTVISVSDASGLVEIQDDQSLLYTPPAGLIGADAFTYVITDGQLSRTATVDVNILDTSVGIDIEFRPADPDQMFAGGAGINGEDVLYSDVGDEFIVEAYISSYDVPRQIVGWQLQYALTNVLAHSFLNGPEWIQLGSLDIAAGETLISGANFSGVLVGEEPVFLGAFTVQTPMAGQFELTTREPATTPEAARTGFAGVGFTPRVAEYGDTILYVGASIDPNVFAHDDTGFTFQDTPLTLDILSNDTVTIGGRLVLGSVGQPTHGHVEINPDSTITYTPDPGFVGVDTFLYEITGGFNSDVATVTIVVESDTPPLPQAVNDSFVITGPAVLDLLANDTHPSGDSLTLAHISEPVHGEIAINAGDQTVTYTPNPGFVGTESLLYTISDGLGNTGSATVAIEVVASPSPDEPFTQVGDDLIFRGTEGRDRITVRSQTDPSRIVIITDTESYGPLTLGPDGVLEIFALGGNDDVRIAGYLDELVTIVDGGNGNDRLFGSGGNDTLIGGTGNDEVFGGDGLNWLDGGSGNDELQGGNDGNVLVGRSGNDRLLGGNGNDVLDGGQGNDELWGLLGDDVLLGREDSDVLLGGTGNDFVFGEGGNDIVKGGAGNDLLFGGGGTDVVNGGRGEDAIAGGATNLTTTLQAREQLSDLLMSWTTALTWDDRFGIVQPDPVDDTDADALIGGHDADFFFTGGDDTPADLASEDSLA